MFWVTSPRLATRFWNILVDSSGSLPARSIDRMCQKNQASRSAADQHEQPDRRDAALRDDDRVADDEVLRG